MIYRRFLITGAVIATALTAPVGCGHTHHDESEHKKYEVTQPLRKDITLSQEYVSQIRSIRHIEVRAIEKGYLEKIYIDEGQSVENGALLFQVVPSLYKADFDRAQAEYYAATIEYKNTAQLRNKNIVSESELALVQARLDKAKAELELAAVHLGFTQVKAPFPGITGRLEVREGSLVEEGELLTTLSDNDEMWVYFNVPEAEYIDFQTNESLKDKKVRLIMANHKPYDHLGEITAIESDFNNETGNIAFRATFPNPEKLLRHGQTGNVLLETTMKDALVIPQKATFEVLDKRYVYLVNDKNKVASHPVSILAEVPDLFIIGDELKADNSILLTGLRKVRDGDTITPEPLKPESVLASLKVYAE